MAIHWQIPFMSLRSRTVYTVNIYDSSYTGSPIVLKGAAKPFVTQENDDDDIFMPVRKQSGYLRIVDDGYDADGNAFNWRSLLPSTDTDRPVTLTAGGQTLWVGFMQAQNFGARLYGNPQEREFPIQCPLSVLEGYDINYTQTAIRPFSYLLGYIISQIPAVCRPLNVMVQGNYDAADWLRCMIDWQNFTALDGNGNLTARFNLYQCLEDMCRFWGWSARMKGTTLYLTMPDDATEPMWMQLLMTDLETMAVNGAFSGSYNINFSSMTITGTEYADTNNDDYQMRGPNRATVTCDTNDADDPLLDPFNDSLVDAMMSSTWNEGYLNNGVHYTKDVLTVNDPFFEGSALEGKASFNQISKSQGNGGYSEIGNVISIKKTFDGTAFLTLATKYQHCFNEGFFQLSGTVYRNGDEYVNNEDGRYRAGIVDMWMALGVGRSRAEAVFWDGKEWVSQYTTFRATIGNMNSEIFTRYWSGYASDNAIDSNIISTQNLSGYVYIDLFGSNNNAVEDIDGQKKFDIKDFKLTFTKNDTVSKQQFPRNGWWDIKKNKTANRLEYKASNQNNVRQDFDADCIYASKAATRPGYGILMKQDGSYLTTLTYNGGAAQVRPEQHLANRVANYWATSKRKLTVDLLTNAISNVTPRYRVSVDGTDCYPIGISRDWRDDITTLTLIQLY